jgi:hypothetical protein
LPRLRSSAHAIAGFALLLVTASLVGCGGDRDAVEQHRRLSLRVEHVPPGRAEAGREAEIHARILSSLESPRLEAWLRIVDGQGEDERIPLVIGPEGTAIGHLPGRPRGTVVRYVIEARDAAGLVVALPRGAADGKSYQLRFEGSSSRLLGGISFLSVLLATLLYLGAGAAGVQSLRGQMSPGPAGMLGGFGAGIVVGGLFLLGGIHAWQLTGRPWPGDPVLFGLSRGDLGIVTLLWVVTLVLGRRVLLDEAPDGAAQGERAFAAAAVAGGALTLLFLLF